MRPHQRTLTTCLAALLSLGSLPAAAHAFLVSPIPRNNLANKIGPCGPSRTATATVFQPGQTIDVLWTETIAHPGHYTISFSSANDTNFRVLVDNIPNPEGVQNGGYRITLPNELCSACTLQLIQVMTENSVPTNYYSCADIRLVAALDGGAGPGVDAGTPGGQSDAGTTASPATDAGGLSPLGGVPQPEESTTGHTHSETDSGPRVATGGCQSVGGAAWLLLPLVGLCRRARRSRVAR
jgi:hypothetical protein